MYRDSDSIGLDTVQKDFLTIADVTYDRTKDEPKHDEAKGEDTWKESEVMLKESICKKYTEKRSAHLHMPL